ncbi:MAG TPA: acetate--CoA ligase [Desulfomonilaceae bacterium]|nr:acetate--CoA ligase [Desulfomonilaceae bacterium]
MENAPKWYDVHLEEYRKIAYIKSMDEYLDLYRRSLEDVDTFWGDQAKQYISWYKEWDFVLRYDFHEKCEVEWFGGGILNVTYNCLDKHLDKLKNKVAYYWEGDNPAESRVVTYLELYNSVNKFAAALKKQGVKKGDRVIVYLPMIVELPVAMLACARIGAIHSVIFGGFSAESIASRIQDCKAKTVITVDGGYRAGKLLQLKKNVDEALTRCPDVEKVIVFNRANLDIKLDPNKEVWWHELIADPELPDYVEPEPMNSEDPLFILYTSGSTGKPKGVLHTQAGYLLHTSMTTKLVFDLKENETFWCTADIGWITGHSYIVYGPLNCGYTSVMFEGVPNYPDWDRFWAIVEKHKVDKFYTAPTAIRSLAKEGEKFVQMHDVSSLKLLGTVGEPINPEAWRWYFHFVGRDWCPIVDTWWQTETGGQMMTPLPGVAPIKPGSCSFPFFGIDPVILDPDTGKEVEFPDQEGALFIKKPWPGMMRTVFGDHERFKETYFSRIPGLYFTGDGAKKDEDGYYWIIGRIDDVINVSGHRMGTAEVESALVLHNNVAEAAVVGFPHPIKGQGIYAFVTVNTGVEKTDALKKDLVALVRQQIGPIATPDAIQWADGLPKTRSGKIMRRILKKIAAGQVDELGDTTTLADPTVIGNLVSERIAIK